MARDLRQDVSGRTETIEADPMGIARLTKRTIADQPGTHQWGSGLIGVTGWDREAEPGVRHHIIGIAAVALIAGKAGGFTEIFSRRAAIRAGAACIAEPGYAHALANLELLDSLARCHHRSDDLVPGN